MKRLTLLPLTLFFGAFLPWPLAGLLGNAFVVAMLPLPAPSLAASLVLTFCFAMLEVSDSLIPAMEARFAPITRAIYDVTGRPSPDSAGLACALGVPAMGILGGGLILESRLTGRRLGSFFRA